MIPNLELLGLVVLQPFNNWSKSLFIVPLCSNCHGSQNLIQAGRKQTTGSRAQHKSQQTLLSPHWQDIYSQFSAQTPCILSSRVCAGVDICSASLWRPWQMRPLSTSLYAIWPIIAVVPILTWLCLLLRWWETKNRVFTANVFCSQSNWGRVYLAGWERVQIITGTARLMRKHTYWEGKKIRVLIRAQGCSAK